MSAPVTVYEIKRIFRAPLGFAYAWCTDYTEADRMLQGDPGSVNLSTRPRAPWSTKT